eukprot:m.495453 g.495453  ORF g.495453 m.495453 type:complete len:777 (-) comp44530_c0_seq1:102-2432(-)
MATVVDIMAEQTKAMKRGLALFRDAAALHHAWLEEIVPEVESKLSSLQKTHEGISHRTSTDGVSNEVVLLPKTPSQARGRKRARKPVAAKEVVLEACSDTDDEAGSATPVGTRGHSDAAAPVPSATPPTTKRSRPTGKSKAKTKPTKATAGSSKVQVFCDDGNDADVETAQTPSPNSKEQAAASTVASPLGSRSANVSPSPSPSPVKKSPVPHMTPSPKEKKARRRSQRLSSKAPSQRPSPSPTGGHSGAGTPPMKKYTTSTAPVLSSPLARVENALARTPAAPSPLATRVAPHMTAAKVATPLAAMEHGIQSPADSAPSAPSTPADVTAGAKRLSADAESDAQPLTTKRARPSPPPKDPADATVATEHNDEHHVDSVQPKQKSTAETAKSASDGPRRVKAGGSQAKSRPEADTSGLSSNKSHTSHKAEFAPRPRLKPATSVPKVQASSATDTKVKAKGSKLATRVPHKSGAAKSSSSASGTGNAPTTSTTTTKSAAALKAEEQKRVREERQRRVEENQARIKQQEEAKQRELQAKAQLQKAKREAERQKKEAEDAKTRAKQEQRRKEALRRRKEEEVRKRKADLANREVALKQKMQEDERAFEMHRQELLRQKQQQHAEALQKAAAIKIPPAAPSAVSTVAAAAAAADSKEQAAAASSAASSASASTSALSHLTTPEHRPSQTYDISSIRSNDSTDDEEDPRSKVPRWAQGHAFKAAIYNQFLHGVDPNTIFSAVSPPDLCRIFPNKQRPRFTKRTSSALWVDSPSRPGNLTKKL